MTATTKVTIEVIDARLEERGLIRGFQTVGWRDGAPIETHYVRRGADVWVSPAKKRDNSFSAGPWIAVEALPEGAEFIGNFRVNPAA